MAKSFASCLTRSSLGLPLRAPVIKDGRVEAELYVRGERLRFVRALLAPAHTPFWLER
ncbi:MAG: hypothetical protein LM580_11190 [Thermofilum sp.]|nr:hypothetical protein [Thermofilum sp.]